MVIILKKIANLLRKEGSILFLYILVLLLLTISVMPLLEGSDSPFGNLFENIWWFMVTITTVGYGDISPTSFWGKLFAMIVMLSGIGLAAGLITYVSTTIVDNRRVLMKGLRKLKVKDHIVILGYNPHNFFSIVNEILADEFHRNRSIVLCSDKVSENPLPDKISFVKGAIHSDDIIKNACLSLAKSIIIHGENDQHNILATLAAFDANQKAHIVTYIENPENVKHINRISPKISIVNPIFVPLIVQEMQDPGTLHVVNELLTNNQGSEIYRVNIPDIEQSWLFGEMFTWFKQYYQATIIGVFDDELIINPKPDLRIGPNSSLFVIAIDRPKKIEWDQIS